jgi:hypothetical protein
MANFKDVWVRRDFFCEPDLDETYQKKRIEEWMQWWEKEEKKPAMELDVKILDSYVGQYEIAGYSTITFTLENRQLYFQFGGMEKERLDPESETNFSAKTFDAAIIFMKNARGEVEKLMINCDAKKIPAKKVKWHETRINPGMNWL